MKIEKFPTEKKQITFDEPPEMIFFDLDEDPEYEPGEAQFIRVDDLLQIPPESSEEETPEPRKLTGRICFTLIPRRRCCFIDSRISPVIHRSIAMTALELNQDLLLTRVRPMFLQWELNLGEADDPLKIIGQYRRNLENEMRPYLMYEAHSDEFFWADECLIRPAGESLSVNQMVRFINTYQKE